jgi:hypothetical protein
MTQLEQVYDLDYLVKKFYAAVYDLATGEGDARSRVDKAYYRFWHIWVNDYPKELREHVEWITEQLTNRSGPQGKTIPFNLSRMQNRTAAKIAERILFIYHELLRKKFADQQSIS